MLISIVRCTVEKKGVNVKGFNGEGWWMCFKQRNPSIPLRTADLLAMVCSECAHQEVFDDYFRLLESTLDSLKLVGKPQCIYNMDEMGMPVDVKKLKRIAPKGMKKVHGQSSGNKTQITVVMCANAASSVIPPYGNIQRRKLNYDLTKDEVPGSYIVWYVGKCVDGSRVVFSLAKQPFCQAHTTNTTSRPTFGWPFNTLHTRGHSGVKETRY